VSLELREGVGRVAAATVHAEASRMNVVTAVTVTTRRRERDAVSDGAVVAREAIEAAVCAL